MHLVLLLGGSFFSFILSTYQFQKFGVIDHCNGSRLEAASIILAAWLNGCVIVYELISCEFESLCCHLNFRYDACVEQEVPWHSGNYRVEIHLKLVRAIIITYSQMHCTYKLSQHSSIIWPVSLNGWVLVYKLYGCGFETRCCDVNFNNGACFEQGIPWHSGNFRVEIHSETRMWHDNNIYSNAPHS